MFLVLLVMSKKVNTSCFIERLFLLQSRRNLGFCIFFFFIFHFPRVLCGSTDENGCSQMVSMSPLIGCRLKFQTDQSRSPKGGGLRKMWNGWINRGNGMTDKRQDVNDSLLFLQTVVFDIFGVEWCVAAFSAQLNQICGQDVMFRSDYHLKDCCCSVLLSTFGRVLIISYKTYVFLGTFCFSDQVNEVHRYQENKMCVSIVYPGR